MDPCEIDIDDEPTGYPRRPVDEPDIPSPMELMREAEDFHREWSRRNPNRVYGHSYPSE